MAGILCLLCRLSYGPAEERYMRDIDSIADDAAKMDDSDEVLSKSFLPVLA